MCPEHKSATRVAKTDMRSPVPRRKRKEDIQIPIIKWGHKTKIINIDWLWKPFIPCSKVTIFEGDGGDGKTTMILTIAAMLSQRIQTPTLVRGHLQPSTSCEPATTFYLTNEDEVAESSLKHFVRAGGNPSWFAYSRELEHHMTINEQELLVVIAKTQAWLIIIDPFQAFLPEGTNLVSITKMRSIFTLLGNVAKSTGAAIVLVGHLNKSGGSKDIHRGFGSADIAASVRSILMVEMDKKDRENRWVRTIKSNFDESDYTPVRLVLDADRKLSFAEYEEYCEEESGPASKTERAMEILEEMLESSPVAVSEIHAVMADEGIGDKTAQRARRRIGAIPDIVNGVNMWRMPD